MTQFLDVLQEAKSHEPQLWLDKLASPKTQVSSLAGETGGPPSRFYRPCPLCQAIMNRRNLGARSGVIVDYCKPHGLWFDGNELAQWIHWARQGGLQPAAAKAGVRNPSAQTGLLDHLVESVLDLLD
jgi:Zn-finger nucleic acid-binding protein